MTVMPEKPLRDAARKIWTVRRAVALVPSMTAVLMLGLILFGWQTAQRQLDALARNLESSQHFQDIVLELPILLQHVQTDLYRMALLHANDAPDSALAAMTEKIEHHLDEIREIKEQLDPRIDTAPLYDAMSRLRGNIATVTEQVATSPMPRVAAVDDAEGAFDAVGMVAQGMIRQSSAVVLSDLVAMREQGNMKARWLILLFCSVGVAVAVASLLVARQISRPILSLAGTVEALNAGRLDVDIPATRRTDEIGKVARAVASFKETLIRNQKLQSERDDLTANLERKVAIRSFELEQQKEQLAQSQADAERARQDMTAQLRAEFGKVINAASAGDFTQRVDTGFSDANLHALANDINSFVGRVDKSVTAISAAMHAMAKGDIDQIKDYGFTGAFADIMTQVNDTAAQIHAQAAQLEHIALHDALTGLPNRRFLEDRIAAYSKMLQHDYLPLAILHIDLDEFKDINDTLGHAAGDVVLKRTADVLDDLAGNDDFVARIGGDEFTMLCPMTDDSDTEKERIKSLAARIVQDLARPVTLAGAEARFGASVGIAFSTADTTDLSHLLADADIALYQSKDAGRNQAQVFSSKIASALSKKRALRDDILSGLERDEFIPYFQPKYDATTYKLVGVEALVRWDHPTKGILPPGAFLAEAEDIRVVPQIDALVLSKSIAVLKDLRRRQGLVIPELSVNVSQQRLYDPDFLTGLQDIDGPFKLSFELIESIFFDDQDDRFYWMLDALRERGIGIQVDDFGSGRASISALTKITPERLKIDRSLVAPLPDIPRSRLLIKGIIDIANSLDIGVTAEGVETMAHAEILRDLGCDILQGFALARPMPAADLATATQRMAS